MMGPTRMMFLAAILFLWGTIEALESDSWNPNSAQEFENLDAEFNSSWIIPKKFSDDGNRFNSNSDQEFENSDQELENSDQEFEISEQKFENSDVEFNSSWIIPKEVSDDGNRQYVSNHHYVLGCGHYTLSPGTTVIIRSENYPYYCPRWRRCLWHFHTSSPQSRLTMFCPVFRLTWGWWGSYLCVRGGNFYKKYCGSRDCLFAFSTTTSMAVYFRSRWGSARGFECYVTASENCGTVNRALRIIGGVETQVNEYPWQVALVFSGTNDAFCGGSLYNDRYIITTAYCGRLIQNHHINVEVLLGAHDLNNLQFTVQRISVEQIIIHENYDPNTANNDIALLKLSHAATLSYRVKPACLPNPYNDYDDVNAVVSGWGTTSEGGSQSSVLLEVVVPTMSNSACANSYGSFVRDNMICAGLAAGGRDACLGDSGGPLTTVENGRWVLIGVVSWGYGCARPNYPGVYTRVSSYLSWLGSHTVGTSTCH